MSEGIIQPAFSTQNYLVRSAKFIDRVKATFLDTIVIIGLLYATSLLLDWIAIESTSIKVIVLLAIGLYEPVMITFGQTIGQRILGIKVVSALDLENNRSLRLNFLQSILRYLFKICLGWISLLTIHTDKYGRAIHDKVAGSAMIPHK